VAIARSFLNAPGYLGEGGCPTLNLHLINLIDYVDHPVRATQQTGSKTKLKILPVGDSYSAVLSLNSKEIKFKCQGCILNLLAVNMQLDG
jgi:hypothetical protein